jgi:hypothetical protein
MADGPVAAGQPSPEILGPSPVAPMTVESIMPERTVREQIMQALEDLPPDATFEDAIERLVFLAKVDEGLAELDTGKGIPHDEAKRRLGM